MQRSVSSPRVSDQYFVANSPPAQAQSSRHSLDLTDQRQREPVLALPKFDPNSHAARKERSRLRFAENSIHFIPLVLILCAVVLWFFSSPDTLPVNR